MFLPTLVLSCLIENVLTGMLTAVIGRGALGRKISIGEAWQVGRIGPVLAAALLVVAIAIGVAIPPVLIVVLLAAANLGPAAALVGVLGGIALFVAEILRPRATPSRWQPGDASPGAFAPPD